MLSNLPSGDSFTVDNLQSLSDITTLPTPDKVRKLAGNSPFKSNRAQVVHFEEPKLTVKYGRRVTIAEAQCLWIVNRHTLVPVPELYGWRTDDGETFIYMQHLSGKALESCWSQLSNEQKGDICKQLKGYITSLRQLKATPDGNMFIGTLVFVPLDLFVPCAVEVV